MGKYYLIAWPESQEWMYGEHSEDVYCNDDMSVFVPEELIDGEE